MTAPCFGETLYQLMVKKKLLFTKYNHIVLIHGNTLTEAELGFRCDALLQPLQKTLHSVIVSLLVQKKTTQ